MTVLLKENRKTRIDPVYIAATTGLLYNSRWHIGRVRIGKEGRRDDCPICELWLSEGRPNLDPRAKKEVEPAVFPLSRSTACAKSALTERITVTTWYCTYITSSNPNPTVDGLTQDTQRSDVTSLMCPSIDSTSLTTSHPPARKFKEVYSVMSKTS